MKFLGNVDFRVLLPFGASAGDEMALPVLDGTSGPEVKITSCPFFGTNEDTIFVSVLRKIKCT
jgi:hypothetical protein